MHARNFLELGAGSGLISIYAAKHRARVTATDINTVAIEYLHINSSENNVRMNIVHSDLFENIPVQQFDIVTINPPYYRKDPKTLLDHAWYCGANGEFFFSLFYQLPFYTHKESEILMVLCDGCDMPMIEKAAAQNGFRLVCVQTKQNLIEKNFIYKVEMIDD
jgi:release factor glutamine methyltransferase